jgi:hypothetical protein
MRIAFLILIAVAFASCRTYVDKGRNIKTDFMDFNYFEDSNEFVYKSTVDAVAGQERYHPNRFSVNLPKKIIDWRVSGNEFYFEYPNKEIIYINSGYKNKGNSVEWVNRETNDDEIYNLLSDHWDKKRYNENDLNLRYTGRSSKVYTDGKVTILLYNIKHENLQRYLTLIASFKYLN